MARVIPPPSTDESALLKRLHELLQAAHARFGVAVDELDPSVADLEVYPCGPTGVLAFIGDYVLAAWPDDEMRAAAPVAYRLLERRLEERGFTRHMVHPLNFRSVKLTRKIGAEPLGVDADGFVHYILRRENYCRPQFLKREEVHRG